MLKYALDNGIIDVQRIKDAIEMDRRKELLEKHPYKIFQISNGKWVTYLPDEENKRVQRVRKTKQEIEDVVVEYWREKLENPTIEEVFDEWNQRKLDLKKISKATHMRNAQIFKRHYQNFGKRRIKNITPEEIGDFLEEQIPKYDLTAKAFSNLKTITRGFLKRAKKRGLISFNVEELLQDLDTSDTDFRKVIKEDYQEVFSEEEMPIMLNYLIDNLDTKNMGLLLMFVTGIRVGELVALKHDVFDGNTLKIRRTETRYMLEDGTYMYDVKEYPKSEAGVRTVVVPEDYAWICTKIQQMNPQGEYVFTDQSGKRMTTNCIRRREDKNCKKLGIYKKSPHKIRKTYGSILLDNNVDKKLIMGQMGHTDILCTENHYHRNRRSINRKTEVLSSIKEFQCSRN